MDGWMESGCGNNTSDLKEMLLNSLPAYRDARYLPPKICKTSVLPNIGHGFSGVFFKKIFQTPINQSLKG